jgi:hypothetical protein
MTAPAASLRNAPWCIHILPITEDRSSTMCHDSHLFALSLFFFFFPVMHFSPLAS